MPVTDRSPTLVVRPELGRLCGPGIPDVPVSGPILIGRRPEWHEPGERPRLIILSDPEQNISRSHLAISVSGWDISVTDLGGPNGTRLRLPSGESRALVPHRPAALVPSTAITLADAVTIWFEVP